MQKASWQRYKVGRALLFSGLTTVWLIDALAKAQLALPKGDSRRSSQVEQ